MFEVTPLLDGRTLVEGTDVKGNAGSTTLWSPSWAAYVQATAQAEALEEFDATVEAFFKPLTDAADALNKVNEPDEWGTVTVGEDVEGKQARTIVLDSDGILLRQLAETDGSKLRWVGNDQLVAIK
jgi:hypothetical protein